ncbi:MAG TPA: signal peptidase I [Candidatus Acidoferrales bacterium]|nr:signal peptidase I [Candidatus Acidoferrales bacterium]
MDSTETGAALPDSSESLAPVTPPGRAPAARSNSAEFLESLLVTILLALFGTTFILQAFKIPSQSMEPTLLVGDHLLVNKFIFEGRGAWYEKLLPYRSVRRGDIIVFRFPFDDHPHYVKRVIGLPGDRISIINQQVYVNGNHLTEPYVVHDPSAGDDPFGDNFPPSDGDFIKSRLRPEWADQIMNSVERGELVVPLGHFFVMGDNRDNSWDSRYWGFVDRRAIMGRPMVIYWSVRATADDYGDRSLLGAARGMGDTLIHLPSRTRWHRMLREVH